MAKTEVMLLGALPVGAQSHAIPPPIPVNSMSPDWRRDFITSAATVGQEPQNLMRVTNKSGPYVRASIGIPVLPIELSGLGRLGKLGATEAPAVVQAYAFPFYPDRSTIPAATAYAVAMLRLAGASIGAYHGYKRNSKSVGAAIGWGIAGYVAPIITTGVGLYQGIGVKKKK